MGARVLLVLCWLMAVCGVLCLGADVGLLGELIRWPSAVGPATMVELAPAPVDGGLRFPGGERTLFGALRLGNGPDAPIAVAFEGGDDPRLWVDGNNNGNLIDDENPSWSRHPTSDAYIWTREVRVSYVGDGSARAAAYFVSLIALRSHDGWDLVYGSSCLRKGMLRAGADVVTVWLGDMDSDGLYDDLDALMVIVDADGDGEPSVDHSIPEHFYPGFPLDIGLIQVQGVTYQIERVTPDGRVIEVARSTEQSLPLPHIVIGEPAPPFRTETLRGQILASDDLLGRHVVLAFSPFLGDGECVDCASRDGGFERTCELAALLDPTSTALIAVSTSGDPPTITAVECSGREIPLVWDLELLRLFRPRLEWLVVIGPDGAVLGKDVVRLVYDKDGHVVGAENAPLSVGTILALLY